MNQQIPNKPGWWWRNYRGNLIPVFCFYDNDDQLVFEYAHTYIRVKPDKFWCGPCLQLGPYDVIVTVPELYKFGDCACPLIGRCKYALERHALGTLYFAPGPGCPRYEGSENTESEEE
jgi:hypothetical protein